MDGSTLPRLTIVIPTFGRPEKAIRALTYWAGRGFRVLMLDGSQTALSVPEAARDDPNMTYLHMPVPLTERLGFAANAIETDYATMGGDDDFFLPSGLLASIEFLDEHPDYVACGGQALGFDRGPFGGIRAFTRYERFRDLDISGSDARGRVMAHFSNYAPASIYAVCRRAAWCEGMALLSGREFPVYAIGETQFEFMMAYRGGIRRLPVLHWLRSHEAGPVKHQRMAGRDASLSKRLTLERIWDSAEHSELRDDFVAHTAATISATLGVSEREVASDLKDAIAAHAGHMRERKTCDAGRLPARIAGKMAKRLRRWRLPIGLRLAELRRASVSFDETEMSEFSKVIKGSK